MNAVFGYFAAGTALALVFAVRCGYVASTASTSPRRGRARLIASQLLSSWLCALALVLFLFDQTLPTYDFTGKIDSIQVMNSTSRRYSAFLRIHATLGRDIVVHASNRSPFFRTGEAVRVRYRGNTGELVKASFYGADGKQEGVFNNASILGQSVLLLIGLFCVWASFKKYRRDPEGAEG